MFWMVYLVFWMSHLGLGCSIFVCWMVYLILRRVNFIFWGKFYFWGWVFGYLNVFFLVFSMMIMQFGMIIWYFN